jgi:integrase
MLTAARTGEAIGAVASEFELDLNLWRVPAGRMKSSGKEVAEEHLVYSPARAKQIVEEQVKLGFTHLFPSPADTDKPLSTMAMLAVLGRLGVRDHTTVHGLCRATFSTWAYETAAARGDVIEACLAHCEADKVKAAYNRAQFNQERRNLLKAWAEYLAQPAAQVVALQAA